MKLRQYIRGGVGQQGAVRRSLVRGEKTMFTCLLGCSRGDQYERRGVVLMSSFVIVAVAVAAIVVVVIVVFDVVFVLKKAVTSISYAVFRTSAAGVRKRHFLLSRTRVSPVRCI